MAPPATTESGSTAYYSVQTNQIHDVNGKLSGLLSLLRDVSLRKKTEHLQNQFLSIVAHELRTPLTAIKAFATILDKGIHGKLPEAQSSMVQSIISQTDRLGHEVDKIINRVVFALIVVGLIIGSALILMVGDAASTLFTLPIVDISLPIAQIGFVFAGLAGAWLLWSVIRSRGL